MVLRKILRSTFSLIVVIMAFNACDNPLIEQLQVLREESLPVLAVPSPPEGLRVDSLPDVPECYTQLQISWEAEAAADQGYIISRDTLIAGNYDRKFSYLPSSNTGAIVFVDTTCVPGSTYYYKVQAKNEAGLSSLTASEVKIGTLPGKAVTEITLAPSSLILPITSAGETLTPSVTPLDASVQNLIWESSVPEIISVSENGELTVRQYGRAVIKAKSGDNSGIEAACTVDVQSDRPLFLIDGSSVPVDSTVDINDFPKSLTMQAQPVSSLIRYTTDGSTPTFASPLYNSADPINLAGQGVDLTFKAAAFDANGVSSPVTTLQVRIRKAALTAPLNESTVISSWSPLAPTLASVWPSGMVSDGRNLFVIDQNRKVIWKTDKDTGSSEILAGTLGARALVDGIGAAARFYDPKALTTDGTFLYLTDRAAVRRITIATGEVITLAGSFDYGYADGPGAVARFHVMLNGITCNGRYLFLVDYMDSVNSYIRRVDLHAPDFTVDTIATIPHVCSGITTDGTSLFITAPETGCIWQCNLNGSNLGTISGNAAYPPETSDGNGGGALFNDPQTLSCDGSWLYIVEHTGLTIRRLNIATHDVTTMGGTLMEGYTNGIAVDGNSLFYLSKAGSNMVLYRHD